MGVSLVDFEAVSLGLHIKLLLPLNGKDYRLCHHTFPECHLLQQHPGRD